MEARHQPQHHEDEQQAGDVERAHQLGQRGERAQAVLADGEGHGAKRADGRQLHDVADDDEQHVRELLDEVEHQRAAAAKTVQRKAEQHRDQQHLQHLAFGKRADKGAGDHVQQKLGGGLHLARLGVVGQALGVERGRVDVHAHARLHHVDDDQADDQRHRAHDLEVQERVATRLADALHVLHARDADHHGAEDDGRDDHLDQLDEAVAQRLHGRAGLGPEVTQDHTQDDGGDDLEVQAFVERFLAGVLARFEHVVSVIFVCSSPPHAGCCAVWRSPRIRVIPYFSSKCLVLPVWDVRIRHSAGRRLRRRRRAIPAQALAARMPQRASAASSLTRASTQRAPSGVCSFFQNGAWVLR